MSESESESIRSQSRFCEVEVVVGSRLRLGQLRSPGLKPESLFIEVFEYLDYSDIFAKPESEKHQCIKCILFLLVELKRFLKLTV